MSYELNIPTYASSNTVPFHFQFNISGILYNSTIDGEPIKSHLSEDQIKKAIEEDADAADRELFNRFRKGSGQNAVISMDTIVQNSVVRKTILYNDNGKKKFLT
jgi:hypothetical protein